MTASALPMTSPKRVFLWTVESIPVSFTASLCSRVNSMRRCAHSRRQVRHCGRAFPERLSRKLSHFCHSCRGTYRIFPRGFRCNGGRAKRSKSSHPATDILGERSLPSYLQRTVTTRPPESERELAFVNTMCELDSGNRDCRVGE